MFEIILWKMPIGSKVMENKPGKKVLMFSAQMVDKDKISIGPIVHLQISRLMSSRTDIERSKVSAKELDCVRCYYPLATTQQHCKRR